MWPESSASRRKNQHGTVDKVVTARDLSKKSGSPSQFLSPFGRFVLAVQRKITEVFLSIYNVYTHAINLGNMTSPEIHPKTYNLMSPAARQLQNHLLKCCKSWLPTWNSGLCEESLCWPSACQLQSKRLVIGKMVGKPLGNGANLNNQPHIRHDDMFLFRTPKRSPKYLASYFTWISLK